MDVRPTAFLARPIKIVVVGAGISGIQFVKDVTTRLSNVDVKVYDKNAGIGGTWFENRYPGCACDIPSHAYQYSWNPNPAWTLLYAEGPEILQYLQRTVDSYNLSDFFQLQQKCIGAAWNEDTSHWAVDFENLVTGNRYTVTCDVFVYATGRLNNWNLPQIPGLNEFGGPVVHTADWPEDLDITDKSVAIIGNGASGVQCLPRISKNAKQVTNFIRNPTWLVPHVFSENGESQIRYTPEVIDQNVHSPKSYYDFRLKIEKQLASSFAGLWNASQASQNFTDKASEHMKSHINSEDDLNDIRPTFPAGCRRFTPANDYMEALNSPSVQLVTSPITGAGDRIIHTKDGKQHEVDVVVCATGFDPYRPRFPVTGRSGASLQSLWCDEGGYESYLAVSVASFPNFFVFNPPICPVNGSAYPGIERASDYMTRVLHRYQTDSITSFSVKDSAQEEFNRWVQARMPEMVWSSDCSSWYKTKTGKVIVPWPGTVLHYYAATENVRWEDFDLRFSDPAQRYSSFGNGVTEQGFTPGSLPWLKSPGKSVVRKKASLATLISSMLGY